MLATERHNRILGILAAQGTVRTVDLAEEFAVTDETIRRDLQILAESKQLTRIHGGASSLNGRPMLQSFSERRSLNVEKKRAIGAAALELIEPGKTYAFDSSTTAYELVCQMPDLPYRVVTNAFTVIDYMVRQSNVEVISIGGRFDPKTQTFVGGTSVEMLSKHNINIAFISCIGLDPRMGASEGFEEQAQFKERLARYAEETVLLVDSTKLDQRSEYFFANLNQIDQIITDSSAGPKLIARLKESGCRVTLA